MVTVSDTEIVFRLYVVESVSQSVFSVFHHLLLSYHFQVPFPIGPLYGAEMDRHDSTEVTLWVLEVNMNFSTGKRARVQGAEI